MSKHSRGPWEAYPPIDPLSGWTIVDADQREVAETSGDRGDREAVNARLLAEALEMFQLLGELYDARDMNKIYELQSKSTAILERVKSDG